MKTTPPATELASPRGATSAFSSLIFFSRWLQAPLYLGLIIAQVVYVWQFGVELWHLIEYAIDPSHAPAQYSGFSSEAVTMMMVLGLVDVVMISNLPHHGDHRGLRDFRVAHAP